MKIGNLLPRPLPVRTDLRAGYRPVQTMVYPNQFGYWMPGWFDLDSLTLCGSSAYTGGASVGTYSSEPGAPGAGSPPPPLAP